MLKNQIFFGENENHGFNLFLIMDKTFIKGSQLQTNKQTKSNLSYLAKHYVFHWIVLYPGIFIFPVLFEFSHPLFFIFFLGSLLF